MATLGIGVYSTQTRRYTDGSIEYKHHMPPRDVSEPTGFMYTDPIMQDMTREFRDEYDAVNSRNQGKKESEPLPEWREWMSGNRRK